MKKVLKVLFGQSALVVLLLALQLFVFFSYGLRIMSDQSYTILNTSLRILSIVLMVHIVNSKNYPEYKLIWIVQLAVFPVFGTLFYLFVQAQKVPLLINKEHKRLRRESAPYIQQDPSILPEIEGQDLQKANYIRYMNEYADSPAFRNTAVTYYPLGEDKWKAMLADMEKAEKYIFLEYYIIGHGQMWDSILEVLKRKAAQGVDVRLMYDGIGCLLHLRHDYPKQMAQYGIKCKVFNPFRPFMSTIQNNRDHRKILVVDGKVAYTGGVNLSDEYVNIIAPYGHWKDTAVRLQGEAAFSFAVMFLELWQISTRQKIDSYEAFRPAADKLSAAETEGNKGLVIPFGESPFDGELVGEITYMDILSKARKYVHITSPYLIIDNEMMTAMASAAKSGVDVTIIVPHVADHWYAHAVAKAYYAELISRGVKLYEYMPGFIHSKSFVSDDEVAVVGTINLDYRSLYLHYECAAWIYKNPVIAEIEEDFQKTLEKSRPITPESCQVKGPKKVLYSILRLFAPLM